MKIHRSLYMTEKTLVSEAQCLFEEHKLSALPICEGDVFIGVLDRDFIEEDAPPSATIGNYAYAYEHFAVHNTTAWDEVIEAFAIYNTDILPVITDNGHYLGYYLLNDFLLQLAETPFIKETGRVLILERPADDYSFAQIAQIAESHYTKILGLYISNHVGNTVHITLKIITEDLSGVLQTFRRYGYGILSEKEDDSYREELKSISRYFEKYLNM